MNMLTKRILSGLLSAAAALFLVPASAAPERDGTTGQAEAAQAGEACQTDDGAAGSAARTAGPAEPEAYHHYELRRTLNGRTEVLTAAGPDCFADKILYRQPGRRAVYTLAAVDRYGKELDPERFRISWSRSGTPRLETVLDREGTETFTGYIRDDREGSLAAVTLQVTAVRDLSPAAASSVRVYRSSLSDRRFLELKQDAEGRFADELLVGEAPQKREYFVAVCDQLGEELGSGGSYECRWSTGREVQLLHLSLDPGAEFLEERVGVFSRAPGEAETELLRFRIRVSYRRSGQPEPARLEVIRETDWSCYPVPLFEGLWREELRSSLEADPQGERPVRYRLKVLDQNGREMDQKDLTVLCDGRPVTDGRYTVSVAAGETKENLIAVRDADGHELKTLVSAYADRSTGLPDAYRPRVKSLTAVRTPEGTRLDWTVEHGRENCDSFLIQWSEQPIGGEDPIPAIPRENSGGLIRVRGDLRSYLWKGRTGRGYFRLVGLNDLGLYTHCWTDRRWVPQADTVDRTGPSGPDRVRVTEYDLSRAALEWNAASDDSGIREYRIYLNGRLAGTVPAGELSCRVDFPRDDPNPRIGVKAVDIYGNESLGCSFRYIGAPEFSLEVLEPGNQAVLKEGGPDPFPVKARASAAVGGRKPYPFRIESASLLWSHESGAGGSLPLTVTRTVSDSEYLLEGSWDYGALPGGDCTLKLQIEEARGVCIGSSQTVSVRIAADTAGVRPEILQLRPYWLDDTREVTAFAGPDMGVMLLCSDDVGVDRAELAVRRADGTVTELGRAHLQPRENAPGVYRSTDEFAFADYGITDGGYTLVATVWDLGGGRTVAEKAFTVARRTLEGGPARLKAEARPDGNRLTWTAGSAGRQSYLLYIQNGGGPWFRKEITAGGDGSCEFLAGSGLGVRNGVVSRYRLAGVDRQTGAHSLFTNTVTVTAALDESAPELLSVRLGSGSGLIRGEAPLEVRLRDTGGLDRVGIYYRIRRAGAEIGSGDVLETSCPAADEDGLYIWRGAIRPEEGKRYDGRPLELEPGDELELFAEAVDRNGHSFSNAVSGPRITAVIQEPMAAPVLTEARPLPGGVRLVWRCGADPAVTRFDIYGGRTADSAGTGDCVRLVSLPVNASGVCSCDVQAESEPAGRIYYVCAVDAHGCRSWSEGVRVQAGPADTEPPAARIQGPSAAGTGEGCSFDASASADGGSGVEDCRWDFGDGSAARGVRAGHIYQTAGTYTVTLTVTDAAGNTAEARHRIRVEQASDSAGCMLTVTVTGGSAAEPARVRVTGPDYAFAADTDPSGRMALRLPAAGRYQLTVLKAGFHAAVRSFSAAEGPAGTAVTVALEAAEAHMGQPELHEMSGAEKAAAGVEPGDPANRRVTRMTAGVTVRLDGSAVQLPLRGCFNANGCLVGSQNEGWGWQEPAPPLSAAPGARPVAGLFPVGRDQLLVICGERHWAGEIFTAQLLVNNSGSRPMTGVKATLSLPDGLSLAELPGGPQSETAELGELPAGGSGRASWLIRADRAGRYSLTATVLGRRPELFSVSAGTGEDRPVQVDEVRNGYGFRQERDGGCILTNVSGRSEFALAAAAYDSSGRMETVLFRARQSLPAGESLRLELQKPAGGSVRIFLLEKDTLRPLSGGDF